MTVKDCPRIKCPHCNSTLCSAVGKDKKSNTKVRIINKDKNAPLKEIEASGDYIIRCSKCGKLISIENTETNSGVVKIPLIYADYKNAPSQP